MPTSSHSAVSFDNSRSKPPKVLGVLCCGCFGIAPLPPDLDTATIVMAEPDVPGCLVLKNFRSPGHYAVRAVQAATCSVVVATDALWICRGPGSEGLIRVKWNDADLVKQITFRMEVKGRAGHSILVVEWDVSLFHLNWSGQAQLRLRTENADAFLREIEKRSDLKVGMTEEELHKMK